MQSNSKSGEKYETFASFYFEQLKYGTYDISFYVLMYCDSGSECAPARDYLLVAAKYEEKMNARAEQVRNLTRVTLDDLPSQNKWERIVVPNFQFTQEPKLLNVK